MQLSALKTISENEATLISALNTAQLTELQTALVGYDNDSCHNNVNPQINLFFMVTFRIKSFLLKLFLSRPGFNAVLSD